MLNTDKSPSEIIFSNMLFSGYTRSRNLAYNVKKAAHLKINLVMLLVMWKFQLNANEENLFSA